MVKLEHKKIIKKVLVKKIVNRIKKLVLGQKIKKIKKDNKIIMKNDA